MLNKKIVTGAALAAGVVMSGQALAGVEGNVAATSNYLWRGITQTGGGAAVSGGVDYSHDSGVYLGGWASNIAADTEIDLYGGFSGEAAGFGYDVGYISYVYPAETVTDFGEVYVGGSYQMVGLTYYYDTDNKDSYIDVSADFDIKEGLSVGLHYGSYTFDANSAADYTDYSVSLNKALEGWDWSLALSDTDADPLAWSAQDEKMQVTVSLSKGFDL